MCKEVQISTLAGECWWIDVGAAAAAWREIPCLGHCTPRFGPWSAGRPRHRPFGLAANWQSTGGIPCLQSCVFVSFLVLLCLVAVFHCSSLNQFVRIWPESVMANPRRTSPFCLTDIVATLTQFNSEDSYVFSG
jgi:hypothetical protein